MSRRAIRASAAMQCLIDALAGTSLPPLAGRLLRYLDDGVIEQDGCVLLRAFATGERFDAERHGSRTEFECSVNHLAFDAAAADAERALATAFTCAAQLIEMLERSPCAGPFRVIVSQHDAECDVRFHRYRSGEAAHATDDDESAVLVLECDLAFA
jgi:hypothetical protein